MGTEILDAALEYLGLGFSVIPIRPGETKKPLLAWTEFQSRLPAEQEVEAWWLKWPDANVGIITGKVSGIFVIDGDGEIGNRWISENLPKTAVYARTGRAEGGCHCFYRTPPGIIVKNKVGWKPKVDIRGEGGYVVAAPSIHHTGRRYELIMIEGFRGWEELAEFNPYATAGNLSSVDFKAVKLPGEEFGPAAKGERNDTLAKILGKLFNAGVPARDAWEFVVGWNRKNTPPMGEAEVKATFQSILNRHEHGGQESRPTLRLVANNDEPPELTETEKLVRGRVTDLYPVECLQPGGLLQEIMTYTEKSSAAHKLIFALSGAIALVGHLCGQRIMTETGLRTNVYSVSLGYSGSGKNAPHSAISHILLGSDARVSIGPTDTASGVALLKWLATDNHPVSLFTFDEIGMMFRGLKNPGSPMSELPRILTKIFSEADRPITKSYADAKLNITIPFHCLSLYASSTPGEFWGNLTTADTVSGFLARLLVFEALDEAERPRPSIDATVPKAITEAVNSIWAISPPIDPARGDIARVPVPFVVPLGVDARVEFQAWADGYWTARNRHKEDEAMSAVFGRAAEHAAKLALIHAASLHGGKVISKKVEVDSIRWAIKTVDACISVLLNGISRNIAKNAYHQEQQRLLQMLEAMGGEAPSRIIYRKLHMPARALTDLVSGLFLSGEIREETREGKHKGKEIKWLVLDRQL